MSFESMENNKRMEDLRKEIQKQRDLRTKAEAERDEARAALVASREHMEMMSTERREAINRADAAEVREAALRADVLATVDAWQDEVLGNLKLPGQCVSVLTMLRSKLEAALTAADPSAWVRREEMEAERSRAEEAMQDFNKADLATARALLERARVALASVTHGQDCDPDDDWCECGAAHDRALAAEIAEALR
jgi:hypothetical protein